ncbi:hypothetical protein CGJ02_19060 [Vibrio parahaemolyticus]|nr:hypothetical protein CGJ02_19060 [Vibrio parahaemolyticus]
MELEDSIIGDHLQSVREWIGNKVDRKSVLMTHRAKRLNQNLLVELRSQRWRENTTRVEPQFIEL